MTKLLKVAVFLVLAVSLGAHAETAQFEEGKQYVKLASPVATSSGDKIEVAEIFWYGCPHCYSFKPLVEKWAKNKPDDVDFKLIPAALGRSWEPHARAFFTLQAMDKLNSTTHDALFDALARDHKPLNTPEALADFLSNYDVDKDAFIKTYNSFGVNAKIQQDQALLRGARVTGVPTMLVDGKYTVSAATAGSHEKMLEVVDYLVKKERAEK